MSILVLNKGRPRSQHSGPPEFSTSTNCNFFKDVNLFQSVLNLDGRENREMLQNNFFKEIIARIEREIAKLSCRDFSFHYFEFLFIDKSKSSARQRERERVNESASE